MGVAGAVTWCTHRDQLIAGSWRDAAATPDQFERRYQCHLHTAPSIELHALAHPSEFEAALHRNQSHRELNASASGLPFSLNEEDRNPLSACLNSLRHTYHAPSACTARLHWADIGAWVFGQGRRLPLPPGQQAASRPILFIGDSLTRHLFEDFACTLQAKAELDVWLASLKHSAFPSTRAACKGWYVACGATEIHLELRARLPAQGTATGTISFMYVPALSSLAVASIKDVIRATAPHVVVVGSFRAHFQTQRWEAYEESLIAALRVWANASRTTTLYVLPPPPAHFRTPAGYYNATAIRMADATAPVGRGAGILGRPSQRWVYASALGGPD